MIKWIASAAGIAVLGLVISLESMSEYGRAVRNRFVGQAKKFMPADIELERLKEMLKDIAAELRDTLAAQAEISVKLEREEKLLVKMQEKLEHDQEQMAALRSRLPGGAATHLTSTSDMKALDGELAERLSNYQSDRAAVEAKERLVNEAKASLEKLSGAVKQRMQAKRELESRLQRIQMDMESLKLQSGGTHLPSDDKLHRAVEATDELELKLQVEQRLLDEHQLELSSEIVELDSEDAGAGAAEFDRQFHSVTTALPCPERN